MFAVSALAFAAGAVVSRTIVGSANAESPLLAVATAPTAERCLHLGSASSTYDELRPESEGLTAYRLAGVWGYLDESGEALLPPVFQSCRDFREGLAAVMLNGEWGFIGRGGDYVVAPEYDSARPFHEGLAAVAKNGRWGYIDHANHLRIPFQFVVATEFEDGRARVGLEDGRLVYVDRDGRLFGRWSPGEVLAKRR